MRLLYRCMKRLNARPLGRESESALDLVRDWRGSPGFKPNSGGSYEESIASLQKALTISRANPMRVSENSEELKVFKPVLAWAVASVFLIMSTFPLFVYASNRDMRSPEDPDGNGACTYAL